MADCHERGETRIRWSPRPDGLEESVQFTPGYNCPVGSMQGHGVHGMEICWYLRGPNGGAQFRIYTDWTPGPVRPGHGIAPDGSSNRYDRSPVTGEWEPRYPMGADVGYHARVPQWEGDKPISDDCPVIGGVCYYDGSGMRADKLVREFIPHGEEVIWHELEDVYRSIRTGGE